MDLVPLESLETLGISLCVWLSSGGLYTVFQVAYALAQVGLTSWQVGFVCSLG